MAGRPGDLAVTGKIAADRTTVHQFAVPWLADINPEGGWRSKLQRHAGLLASLDLTLMRLPGGSLTAEARRTGDQKITKRHGLRPLPSFQAGS
jgi:hypothetical protein